MTIDWDVEDYIEDIVRDGALEDHEIHELVWVNYLKRPIVIEDWDSPEIMKMFESID